MLSSLANIPGLCRVRVPCVLLQLTTVFFQVPTGRARLMLDGVGNYYTSGPRGPKSQPQVFLSGLRCRSDFVEQSSWEQSKQKVCSSRLPKSRSACEPSHLGPLPTQTKGSAIPLFPTSAFNTWSSSWPGFFRGPMMRKDMRFQWVADCQRKFSCWLTQSQGAGRSLVYDPFPVLVASIQPGQNPWTLTGGGMPTKSGDSKATLE